jgi:hypothetical protein
MNKTKSLLSLPIPYFPLPLFPFYPYSSARQPALYTSDFECACE